ncbi:MAG: TetR/AcrR family transcriptional regulator [Pseudomonadota bacterium]
MSEAADNLAPIEAKAGYHHGDLHQQLINAVHTLVEEKGADGFSVAEAARKAGVSSAAPYRHFKDKDAILRAAVLDAMEKMRAAMEAVMAPHPVGSPEAVNALGQHYIDFARERPGMFRLMFGITRSEESDCAVADKGSEVFGIVIKAVADYMGISADDPEARRRAYILWTVVHGHSWLTIDGKADQQKIDFPEPELLQAVSKGVLGRPTSASDH